MLDPIVAFFQRIFAAIGRGIGLVIAWILWPFMTVTNWYRARGWIIKGPIGIGLLVLIGFYAYFIWQTQMWSGFNPDYVNSYNLAQRKQDAGTAASGAQATTPATGEVAEPEPKTCVRSAIVDVTADLIDYNVDQNAWISSMLLYKLGLFGLDWDKTPWFDNKASFQRGINQAVRRTAVELVDSLGRVRGTSGINADLQRARGNIQFDEETWYFGSDSLLPKTPTPNYYRTAMADLRKFNASLEACDAIFDGRSDNLIEFLDRIANDIGSTSAIIRERSEFHNGGWFDTRADDRFWFAYGQLYGYYGILAAAGADFDAVIKARGIEPLWVESIKQLRSALNIQPAIISNGREDGWIMPTHLATMGFYILRVRSNLVEMRDVLAR
ncbi:MULTISPECIES: DUF2333 family protein [unclassified Shinella]|jgi:hypothetical protein|uniref:DUF2333 family protein n=1 Tax=unclassified Shinella TaxID=2643062 RepID=UPI0003C53A1C|nr:MULTISPECIES: DUF2333 family protein [unclassified Shinella]EYR83479.1 hypothetical protein SHLA_32c000110 [Shinella sp. DD12]MCO5150984.1 DUF2333 family protein [Shinella sp.]MDC7263006.1 DUF2333 family protein [Shinella sp. HY16]MDC7269901.1 DUF2333 family protein [Shinella sp. YZ44]MDG4670081.1 DUF2333 family protein [Shinella sp. 838]